MEIKVKIEEDKFYYSYKIGISEQNGSCSLTEQAFVAFGQILCFCKRAMDASAQNRLDKLTSEVGAKAWIDANLSEAEEYLRRHSSPN